MTISDADAGVFGDDSVFLTTRGLAKFSGVSMSVIVGLCNDWDSATGFLKPRAQKIHALLQELGYEHDQLYVVGTHRGQRCHQHPELVCIAVLKYYALHAKNPTPVAQANLSALVARSFRDEIHLMLGHRTVPTPSNDQSSWRELKDRLSLNPMPRGYFSVFREMDTLIYRAIDNGLNIGPRTIPDISVGQHWSRVWKQENLEAQYGPRRRHPHEYPSRYEQSKASVEPWVYPLAAVGRFHVWLEDDYVPHKFRGYLAKKVTPEVAERVLAAASGGPLLKGSKK